MSLDWGIKVSNTGKSVTSTDPLDYSLWSKFQGVMRIAQSDEGAAFAGSGNVSIDSSGAGAITTVTVTHNLGYIPFFQVLTKWTGTVGGAGIEIENSTYGTTDSLTGTIDFQATASTTTLTLRWVNTAPVIGAGADYYYLVGRDPL